MTKLSDFCQARTRDIKIKICTVQTSKSYVQSSGGGWGGGEEDNKANMNSDLWLKSPDYFKVCLILTNSHICDQ